jgi:CHASE2 domain-containing sensor protein
MLWPNGAWAFSKLFGDDATRRLAGVFLIVAAIGFVAGGAGVLMRQAWWRPVIVSAAAFSAMIYILFWDGKMRRLDDQGGIGILINIAILVAVLILNWPDFEF